MEAGKQGRLDLTSDDENLQGPAKDLSTGPKESHLLLVEVPDWLSVCRRKI